jgi:hypothetical protein
VTIHDQNPESNSGTRAASIDLDAAARAVLPIRRAADFIPHDDRGKPVAHETGGSSTQVVSAR